MKDLFYTEFDKNLFWVSGYDIEHNNSYVTQFTQRILEDAQKFADASQCKLEEVRSFVVEVSRRYKYMRVFYVTKELIEDTIPTTRYFIKTVTEPKHGYSVEQLQWNMWKWLED